MWTEIYPKFNFFFTFSNKLIEHTICYANLYINSLADTNLVRCIKTIFFTHNFIISIYKIPHISHSLVVRVIIGAVYTVNHMLR